MYIIITIIALYVMLLGHCKKIYILKILLFIIMRYTKNYILVLIIYQSYIKGVINILHTLHSITLSV